MTADDLRSAKRNASDAMRSAKTVPSEPEQAIYILLLALIDHEIDRSQEREKGLL